MATEKRLIDANALKEEHDYLMQDPEVGNTMKWCEAVRYYNATKIIEKSPTVDAVEVVHGYWHIDDYDSGDPGYYSAYIEVHCSKCGYELGAESGQYGWSYGDPFPLNYCPNCGAKMDGDGNE